MSNTYMLGQALQAIVEWCHLAWEPVRVVHVGAKVWIEVPDGGLGCNKTSLRTLAETLSGRAKRKIKRRLKCL